MEKTKETGVKPSIQENKKNNTFIKVNELTEEMFKGLPRIKCTLKKTISKKGFTRCSLEIEVNKNFIKPSIQLSDVRFNYLRLELGLETFDRNGREVFEHSFLSPYRFVKGTNSNGEYKSIEIIMGQHLSETYFFNNKNETGILDILESKQLLKINWLTRPDKIDVVETLNSKWDE